MSDFGPIQVDPSLPEEVEQGIQKRWLGLTQMEFGAVQTNYFMMQARVEALMAQRVLDLQHLEALKIRVANADENVKILQDQMRAAQAENKALHKKLETASRRNARKSRE